MDGLARLTGGVQQELTLGGKTYRLATPTVAAWAAAEAQFLRQRPNILAQALEAAGKVPASHAAAFWDSVLRSVERTHSLRSDELAQLSPFAQAVLSWLLVLHRHHRQELGTWEQVTQWLDQVLPDVPMTTQIAWLAPIIEGGIKNSAGPAAQAPPAATSPA